MSAEEKSMILEQIAKMAEADKAFVTGWAAGRLSMVKPKEEKKEAPDGEGASACRELSR